MAISWRYNKLEEWQQAMVACGGAGMPLSWSGGIGMAYFWRGHKREVRGDRQRRHVEARPGPPLNVEAWAGRLPGGATNRRLSASGNAAEAWA